MKNKKYCIALTIFSLLLTISLINIERKIDSWPANDKIHLSSKPMQEVLFEVGMMYGPSDLDPHDAWDSRSYVIDQVCEGLFALNLSDPEMAIIPNLALSGTWNPAGTEYTCILRQGVTFHDGAPFNADAVNFTWSRLNWALNVTGTITNPGDISKFAELYELPDGRPIVSSITKNGDYNITFVLNDPYALFESLLCFSGSYMLSPSSTPATAYIDTLTGDLVGTGPFVYDNYTPGVEVNFHAFDNYWKGKANITALKFQIIQDTTARNTALLAGDVHFIDNPHPSYYSQFKADPDLIFLNTSTTGLIVQGLGMNNKKINRTVREAISYAIDYDYMINELLEGQAVRLKSPIPNGILYANDTFDVPTLDITRARSVMQSMGYGIGFTMDSEWEAVAAGSTPFLTVNFTYNIGNKFREDTLVLLQNNLAKIGIKVLDNGLEWGPYLDLMYNRVPGGWDKLSLWFIGWLPDYNDPSNYVNSLMSNVSSYNSAQINDPTLEAYMLTGLQETDQNLRKQIYHDLQKYVVEELRPWAWGYVNYVYNAYDQRLTGFQQNAMNKLYFYPCEWISAVPILPEPFSILSDADDPDTDGNFNITWTPSTYADNYSLYAYSGLITEINGSLTLLLDESSDTSYEVSGYSTGTYHFVVIARNGNGDTMSSNLVVNIVTPDPPSPFTLSSDAWTPDTDGDFNLIWTPSTNADNYSLYVYSGLITEINGSLTIVLDEVSQLSYQALDYSDGTYYFIVVAKNAYGTTLSNNKEVVVGPEEPEPEPIIHGFEMWTMVFTVSSVGLILLLRKKKKIT